MDRRRTRFPGDSLQEITLVPNLSTSLPHPSPNLFVPQLSPSPSEAVPDSPISPPPKRQRQALGPPLPKQVHAFQEPTNSNNQEPLYDIVHFQNPWDQYTGIVNEDQAGDVTVSLHINAERAVVAVRRQLTSYCKGRVVSCKHQNIVNLLEAFYFDEAFYFVYESMSVPLAALLHMPGPNLRPFEIATICKEVLQGLRYLHNTMRLAHGALSITNVMLDAQANVKLGKYPSLLQKLQTNSNIATSMLSSSTTTKLDITGTRLILEEMLDPGYEDADRAFDLQKQNWNDDLKTFHRGLANDEPASDLLRHAFLKASNGPRCLKPRLIIAERGWFRNWKVCENVI